jgi:glyoxylase-like metal-dependent hydrolase (beta-lactamase superfamily II)
MHRRNFIMHSAIALPALDSLVKSMFADPWTIKMLNKTTGIFTEKGGTILFKFSKQGIIVVDSQFPDQADHLITEIKKRNDKPFELLINTHHHGDHTGGNKKFEGIVNRVLAHDNSKANQMRVAKANNTEAAQLYPSQTYDKVWSEKIGKDRITLQYFGPGHTNGDSLVYFEHDGIVHTGDLMFNRRHPFVDRSSGASIRNWIKVLDMTMITFPKSTTYVFGHAAEGYPVLGSKDDLLAFKNYLDALLMHVSKEIALGKSKEEIVKATGIPDAPEWKGDGITRPLTAAFEELTSK